MADYSREYLLYREGCARLGQSPLEESGFAQQWEEFQKHAEMLRTAEADDTLAEVDSSLRAQMLQRFQKDPFVRALLVGMAESRPPPATGAKSGASAGQEIDDA